MRIHRRATCAHTSLNSLSQLTNHNYKRFDRFQILIVSYLIGIIVHLVSHKEEEREERERKRLGEEGGEKWRKEERRREEMGEERRGREEIKRGNLI